MELHHSPSSIHAQFVVRSVSDDRQCQQACGCPCQYPSMEVGISMRLPCQIFIVHVQKAAAAREYMIRWASSGSESALDLAPATDGSTRLDTTSDSLRSQRGGRNDKESSSQFGKCWKLVLTHTPPC